MTEEQNVGPEAETAVVFGNYLIHELIGAGGMAEVYRASVREPDERVPEGHVVIKRVKPQHAKDPGFIQMFVDEAKLSAQLQHPNIVSVYEYGESDGHHYIAMEYIDGLHLQGLHVRYAQRNKAALPWAAGIHIVRDLLRGLQYAHGKADDQGRPMGLIHRDINLVNIMVARSGAVKVLDFGIVKAADGIRSAETVGGVLKGKFGYMSPEQAEGRSLDPRSDVFSSSIVLHELLTGRRLFWGKDDLEILRKVRDGDIPDPREFTPEVPADLVEVVNHGLARQLNKRYQSAGEMADALDEILKVHHIGEDVLPELMESLLEAERSEASNRMAKRRRKMTLLAWQQGVTERESPRPARASGVLGGQDVKATATGKKAGTLEAATEEDTLITTDVKYMTSVGENGVAEPVLGEQDVAALEGLSVSELGALGTMILSDYEVQSGAALAEDKTQILQEDQGPGGPTLGLSAEETVLLDDAPGVAPDAAAGEQKTVILDAEDEADLGAEVPPTGIIAPEPAATEPAEEGPAGGEDGRRRRVRILLAIAALVTAVVILLLILKNQ